MCLRLLFVQMSVAALESVREHLEIVSARLRANFEEIQAEVQVMQNVEV